MALPSFSSIELQLLICVIGGVIFVGSFLAILVSAIFGLGLARLLYKKEIRMRKDTRIEKK